MCFLATGKMSRSDYPPGYDESMGPPYGGNYPQPPAYGFPGYGGPYQGQPSAPYPTDVNTPLYSGQPGGYPGGPYSGQPYSNNAAGDGYPRPPPMPPMVPPTIPSDVLSSGTYFLLLYLKTQSDSSWFVPLWSHTGDGFAARGSGWDSISVRHAFIRKVKHFSHTNHLRSASVCPFTPSSLHSFSSLNRQLVVSKPAGLYVSFRSIGFWPLSWSWPQRLSLCLHLCEYAVGAFFLAPPLCVCVCYTADLVSVPQRTGWRFCEEKPSPLLGVIVRTLSLYFSLLFQFMH